MGYNMVVYCRCFENGLTRTPPIPINWIVRDRVHGYLVRVSDYAFEKQDGIFDEWAYTCCDHELSELSNEHLGNIATVAGFRRALEATNENQFLSLKSLFCEERKNPYLVEVLQNIQNELTQFRASRYFSKECEYSSNALQRVCVLAIENRLPAYLS